MDHHHHPPSSSTTTKKEEEEDLSHDDKRANTNASSFSSATINDHDADTLPLPQPPPLHLYSLPDIAHDAIASYLTMKDMHCMMDSSQWLLKAYGGRVKELRLCDEKNYGHGNGGDRDEEVTMALVLSVMRRRPGLVRVTVGMDKLMGVVAEAMRKGYCDTLQLLEIIKKDKQTIEDKLIQALCDALADGFCPKINALVVPGSDDLVPSMRDALQSRMGKGCCGLKSLEIQIRAYSLSPLLSSGACEALEELKLELMETKAKDDLSEWLLRTKAPHLRAFVVFRITPNVAHALCSPGIAPRLQVLELTINDPDSILRLSQTIGGGAWPQLREFRARVWDDTGTRQMVPSLVEAIGVGARELTTLKLGDRGVGPEGGMAMARMLRNCGCPRLEELDLSYSTMGDDAVVELARALEGGTPCNTTLRRLGLDSCRITSVGMRELMESMGRGALPHLKCLHLGSNSVKDDGVVSLAQAMAGGLLQHLQELRLWDVDMDQRGARALSQAFRDHKPCPHLKKLHVGTNKIGDDGVVHLAEAIETGALQHLQELYIHGVDMGDEGFKSLVKAIVSQQPNPGCPRLEMLYVTYNYNIGDGGVMYLAEVIKMKGAMQHLRKVDLDGQFESEEGLRALSEALSSSYVCPNLEVVNLGYRYSTAIRKEMADAMVRRTQERRGTKLRFQVYEII